MASTGTSGRRLRSTREAAAARRTLPSSSDSLPMLPGGLAQTGEYSIFGLARPGDPDLSRERRVGFALIIFAIATVIAVLYALERYFYRRLLGQPVSLSQLVPAELVFTYAWALLTPLVIWMGKRFPAWGSQSACDTRRMMRNWAAQLVAMLGFAVLHVALFTAATLLVSGRWSGEAAGRVFGGYLASWFVLDSIVYCTLLAVYHALVYYRVSQDRALRASQLETRLAQAQLQMLRMQLQPHFLFNTLHTISALMHRDVKRADSMIAALSVLLRMSLRTTGTQEVPLREEVEFLERYIEIMSLRFGDRLVVTVDVDPTILDARVPTLLLQPLVENSLRHGFNEGIRGGRVSIVLRADGDTLRCEIIDDGRGIPREGIREGVGIANTRARLKQLYGERHEFELRGEPAGGTCVSLVIPLHFLERTAAD
jgi:two-component system, LytTR family, sensor kinase